MANLESLDLQINGSAEQAKGGIDRLITSLSSLSKAIDEPFNKLTALRGEMTKIGAFRMPSTGGAAMTGFQRQIDNTTRSATRFVDVLRQVSEARAPAGAQPVMDLNQRIGLSRGMANHLINNATQEQLLEMKIQSKRDALVAGMASGTKTDEWVANQTSQVQRLTAQYNNLATARQQAEMPTTATQLTNAAKSAAPALANVANEEKKTGESGEKGSKGVSKFGKVLGSIGRIAQTLLIRTAIKSLYKAFSESWQAMYQFSKANDGAFAQSLERMKGLLHGATTNILTAFAPAIQALVPIVNVLAGAIQFLCNMVSQLFSLLGMSSEFFGASTDAVNAYTKSAKGGGGATKEMLASFDELNVITSAGGGGGGGGGGGIDMGSGLIGAVSDDMAKLQMIVGESLLGIGLILACCGHIPLGIGLMAIGASAIVKTIVQDWGKLTDQTKQEIAEIMAACAVGFLALGFIVAATGHVGLGIGLMVAGVANMAGIVAMGFNDMLDNEIKKKVTAILGIGGSLLFVAGLIVAIAGNLPLGIGLMVAGGASVASSVALNWDTIGEKIKPVVRDIRDFFVNAWDKVTGAIGKAWTAVSKWWEEDARPWIHNIWSVVSTWFRTSVWEPISKAASLAWEVVSDWWEENVTSKVEAEGIWGGVKGFFEGVWNGISEAATSAWNVVCQWWGETIQPGLSRIWAGISNWFNRTVWEPLMNFISPVWEAVSEWWGEKIQPGLSRIWAGISDWFNKTVWKPLCDFIKPAWDAVSDWWGNKIQPGLSSIWSGIASWFDSTVWTPVKNAVDLAWKAVVNWWQEGILPDIEKAWKGVQKFFTDMWEAITKPLRELWDYITKIFGVDSKTAEYTVTVVTNQVTKKSTTVQTTNGTKMEVPTASSLTQNLTNPTGMLIETGKNAINWVKNLFGANSDAAGAYGIPSGDLFIANEAGAELVGTINGKTSVANQSQIIEGISNGVERAQAEQNRLLREQNDLLRGILDKDTSVRIGASAALGRVVNQSQQMYARQVGG